MKNDASHDSRFFRLQPDLVMPRKVSAGERFSCRTLDASGDQMREGVHPEDLDRERFFPVNGPIGISGVRAGDAVGLEIHSIVADDWGHTWTRRGLGVAAPVDFHVRRMSSQLPVIDWGASPLEVPSQLHVGTIGLLPAFEAEPRSLGTYGGNLDSVHCTTGATLWLTAQVDGGGLFLGDVHAAIGSAEVCGTGIEVAARLELSVHVKTTWAPKFPTVQRDGRTWLICDGDDFDSALERGVNECTRLLSAHSAMTMPDAYLAVGLLLEVQVCQVVNPRRSLALSLAGGADVALGPA